MTCDSKATKLPAIRQKPSRKLHRYLWGLAAWPDSPLAVSFSETSTRKGDCHYFSSALTQGTVAMIYLVADDMNLAHARQFGFCGTKGVFVLMVTHRGTTTQTHGASGEVLRNMTGGKEKKDQNGIVRWHCGPGDVGRDSSCPTLSKSGQHLASYFRFLGV